MTNNLINSFSVEWIKKRRSFASWLVIIGGFFVCFISVLIFLVYPNQLIAIHKTGNFWQLMFQKSWQMMAFMLLPMGIVLAVSLITQIEFKNNSWKQLHTTPVSFSIIYFSKLAVLLVMLLQLFLFFNIGIYISALVPSLLNRNIPFPDHKIDFIYLLRENANYFIISLPMVALQYMIGLQFRNFLISVGTGLAFVVGGLMALSWKYIYMIPSAYTAVYFLQTKDTTTPVHDLRLWALGYFLLFVLLGYLLYIFRKEKG